jgi:hypothetical protein
MFRMAFPARWTHDRAPFAGGLRSALPHRTGTGGNRRRRSRQDRKLLPLFLHRPGTGRFTPLDGASPYVGQVGSPEIVPEDRIECVVEQHLLAPVVAALRSAHPYEEPAFMSWRVDGWR